MTPELGLAVPRGAPARPSKLWLLIVFGSVFLLWWLLRALADR